MQIGFYLGMNEMIKANSGNPRIYWHVLIYVEYGTSLDKLETFIEFIHYMEKFLGPS